MRFGGHETFHLRSGWLTKGLMFVASRTGRDLSDPLVADELGVGRNMAKSIKHWVQATGVAQKYSRDSALEITPLGQVLLENDPYLQRDASWWALHINIVTQEAAAVAWSWFFNSYQQDRFDRLGCVEAFARAVESMDVRMPSMKTLSRDVQCLLQSYARPLPLERADPEDALDSPFRMLGLLVFHRDTELFERRQLKRRVPPEVLMYALSKMVASRDQVSGVDEIDVSLADALSARNSPGRLLGLNIDSLSELVTAAEEELHGAIYRHMLGGEHMLRVRVGTPESWLSSYFSRTGGLRQ